MMRILINLLIYVGARGFLLSPSAPYYQHWCGKLNHLFSTSAARLTGLPSSAPRSPWWTRGPEQLVATGVEEAFALSKCILPTSLQPSDLEFKADNNSAVQILDPLLTPLLCFVNRDSGGRRGKALLASLRSLNLNPLQICDLKEEAPGDRLRLFKSISDRLHVLCCGGDGTVNWVMDELSSANMTTKSFGLIPLGTGNDLYLQTFSSERKKQQKALQEASATSYAVSAEQLCANPKAVLAHHARNLLLNPGIGMPLDRWTATTKTTELTQYIQQQRITYPHSTSGLARLFNFKRLWKVLTLTIGAKRQTDKVFSNYIGFGVDGAVSLSFAHLRSAAPFLFFNRIFNKLWYAVCGIYQVLFGQHRRDLSKTILLTCDGCSVPIPPGIRGLVALNINSYAGGTRLWKSDKQYQTGFGARQGLDVTWRPSCPSDRILEVMGVYGIRHLGLIKSGLASAVPICQGSSIQFNCTLQTPMQIDGEPFMQKPCVVDLTFRETINVTVPVITDRRTSISSNSSSSSSSSTP